MLNTSRLTILASSLLCCTSAAFGQQAPQNFPDGPGKDTVVAVCGGCHDINRARAGYTPAGWNMLQHMMQNFEAPIAAGGMAHRHHLPDEEPSRSGRGRRGRDLPARCRPRSSCGTCRRSARARTIRSPPRTARSGGPANLSNKLGRVDPKTGAIREYTLKTPHTGPHGLVEDKDGNIWFTGNHAALIGKLDPKTGLVTEYKMPDPKVKDPHTLVVRAATASSGSPRSKPTRSAASIPRPARSSSSPSPTPSSRPYGMLVNSKSVVDVRRVRHQQARDASIRKTMAIKEYALPDAGVAAAPHRDLAGRRWSGIRISRAASSAGSISATGEVTEWPSPSGPKSQPYGIVFAKGAIWYNESFAKPNTIVRFDPKTEKFQTWAIPGRRRHRAQHGRDARRQSGDGQQPDQSGRTGRDQVA